MQRRDVLILLCGSVGAWALPSRHAGAQTRGRLSRIGVLGNALLPPLEAMRAKLRELGYTEGRNLAIEFRFAQGREDRYPAFVSELADLPVDVIVAWGTPAAVAAKAASSRIPILFVAGDAVNTGIVSSLSRPEANITGFIAVNAELEEKRLELLKEIVPRATRVAVLSNAGNPLNRVTLETVRRAGRALGVSIEVFEVRNSAEIGGAVQRLVESRPDGAIIGSDIMMISGRQQIATALNNAAIPAVYPFREYAGAGAFIIYGANISVLFQNVAAYADRILKGESPANLPIQQATAFELIVDLKAAQKIGLTLPPAVLARVDEVMD
jgi:putative tryptophan/tyrosine transport system substrate-binding protein